MQTLRSLMAVVGFSALTLLSGCVVQPARPLPPPPPPPPAYGNGYAPQANACVQCGVVSNVQQIVAQQQSAGSPLGTVIGAVAGGLIGSTIGHGGGRFASTVVGTVVGGAVGSQVGPPAVGQAVYWQIVIRLDDGRTATVTQAYDAQVRPGDYVQIRGDQVFRL